MSGRKTALVLALVLAAWPAAARDDDNKARPREGASSSGRSSSAGERHHSSDTHSSSASSGSSSVSSGSGSSSLDSSSRPPLTEAQRRHPRAGTGTGHRLGGTYYFGWPYYYYDPYRYSWYDRYGYYSPYYYSGYYGYGPYSYRSSRYPYRIGSVRVLVDPPKTRVYVDGYYAGIVDDFDGLFQRLNLSSGRHEITLKLEGYRSHRIRIYVPLDQTIKIHHDMVRGTGEDPEEWMGEPQGEGRYEERGGAEDRDEDVDAEGREEALGTLRLGVRPQDASIYVDGAFRGTGRLRSLSLPPGRHHVEIVRPGYRTLEREIEVQAGEATDLDVDLDRS